MSFFCLCVSLSKTICISLKMAGHINSASCPASLEHNAVNEWISISGTRDAWYNSSHFAALLLFCIVWSAVGCGVCLNALCIDLPTHPQPTIPTEHRFCHGWSALLSYRAKHHPFGIRGASCGRRRPHAAVQPDLQPKFLTGKLLDEERGGDPRHTGHE